MSQISTGHTGKVNSTFEVNLLRIFLIFVFTACTHAPLNKNLDVFANIPASQRTPQSNVTVVKNIYWQEDQSFWRTVNTASFYKNFDGTIHLRMKSDIVAKWSFLQNYSVVECAELSQEQFRDYLIAHETLKEKHDILAKVDAFIASLSRNSNDTQHENLSSIDFTAEETQLAAIGAQYMLKNFGDESCGNMNLLASQF